MSSQTDLILTRIEERSIVTDARSIPNVDLETDHRPVIFVSGMQKGRTPRTKRKARGRQVNLRKVQKEEVRQEVETHVTKKLKEVDIIVSY